MIKYEDFTNLILQSASDSGLDPYHMKNQIDTISLERNFSFLCVPIDDNPPHLIRAEISFHWDSMLTAESIYGGNCSLYHDETEECTHDDLDNEAFTELEIEYQFEIDKNYLNKTDFINKELINTFQGSMTHNSLPFIRWEAFVNPEGKAGVSKVTAGHHWIIKLEEEEFDFEGIFLEINNNIQLLSDMPFIKKSF
ncbi:hypothetical protein [Paenibacillus sp. IHBB 10380]|uniref:hypothetical protein n=1 Tax=Paenibacillus sp. IHBB 10380 TaxID=1566358 RepID=UPI0005CFB0D3|nr:hypothetical protein [Paenibacillus sp. IHBB 10380]AJS58827.1 hypothetical protein UB51_10460 [Paenibacillus sp. IHBB 10380]